MNILIDKITKRVNLVSRKIQNNSAPIEKIVKTDDIQDETIVKSDAQVVSSLIKKSNRILTSATTHKIPIDIFPDTINVEESRVTIIRREFFLSSRVHSVDIKDISNIFLNTSPLRAQLIIVSNTYTKNDIRIKNLKIKQAIYIRRIIEGLRTFETNQIDTSVYSKSELVNILQGLSKTKIVV